MNERLLLQAELHLRLHLHSLVPLHELLNDIIGNSAAPPLELATTLEDIGQRYLKMAESLNRKLIRCGRIDEEPEDQEDFAEERIARFARDLVAGAGTVVFRDGMRLDGRAALSAFPAAEDAIKAAVLLARAERSRRPRLIS